MSARAKLAALLVVTTGLVGACGSDDGGSGLESATLPADSIELIAAAPDRLAAASTARIEMRMTMTGLVGESFDVAADGAFDLATGDGEMTMDMAGLGLVDGTGSIEVRVVDGVVYLDFGAFADALGLPALGARWMKLDPTALAEDLGLDPADLGLDAQSMDLTSSFDLLRDVAGDIEDLGRQEVRGVETTHYRVGVDLPAVLDEGLSQLPPELSDLFDTTLLGGSAPSIPIDVWVDDDGLLHRMEMRVAVADVVPADAGVVPDATLEMTFDIFDFGVDVDVAAPPDSETVELLDMLGSFGGSSAPAVRG